MHMPLTIRLYMHRMLTSSHSDGMQLNCSLPWARYFGITHAGRQLLSDNLTAIGTAARTASAAHAARGGVFTW